MSSASPPPLFEVADERPVDDTTIALLREVKTACDRLGAEFVLAGAAARDIQMWHVHGVKAPVATRDVDVAVCVVSWAWYDELVALLGRTGRFEQDAKEQQKLLFRRPGDAFASQLDLVPFGALEAPPGAIAWPPGEDIVLTVLGFQEAVDTACSVHIGEGLVVPVVALPAFALLKLIAWKERRARKNSDASDLLFILRSYVDAGNGERLFEHAADLLVRHDFKAEYAAAGLLGREASAIAKPQTREFIRAMLDSPRVYDMLRADLFARAATQMFGEPDENTDALLAAFAEAFASASPRTGV
ncbi:nucleotidyl transferase AbiEii/AbiGii toxin family protein [Paraburkholderia sp. J94]|uniref:nucleotidyl transferase AbiEii/AbiGii toxin family protein n=1 Tax=Paraburkholderia sp. J94 TaxID=2805441 RepID=UPI002AB0AFD9|nr:nucleotidyl transferase AbiEii/AbiGii toxin family protein [Paraburkholderia sp. J94]